MSTAEVLDVRPHPTEPVIIYDGGAQYRDLFYWKAAALGYRSQIVPFNQETQFDVEAMLANGQAAIIAGSNKSVTESDIPQLPEEILDGVVPTMGVCFGSQVINHQRGGKIGKYYPDPTKPDFAGEFGTKEVEVEPNTVTFHGMERALKMMMNHSDSILTVADGYHPTGYTQNGIAAYENHNGRVIGTLFHPEVNESEYGTELIEHFLKDVAGLEPDPNYNEDVALREYLEEQESKIADILESGGEITGLISGGVDSALCAAMALKVATELGRIDQLDFYFIDNGLMRVEDDDVVRMLAAAGIPVKRIDASSYFFDAPITLIDQETNEPFVAGSLSEASDPQLKRRLIGQGFLDISEALMEMKRRHSNKPQYLMQGTNSADFNESGGNEGDVIKWHHNVTPETDAMRADGRIFEPLRIMLKHHVRKAAKEYYGLPDEIVYRQPFPGPGFGPRNVVNPEGKLYNEGEEFEERQRLLDELMEEYPNNRAHLIPLKTVGNKGDGRSLADIVVIDGIADWENLPVLSQRITDIFPQVNRVFFAPGMRVNREDIAGVKTKMTPEFIEPLREMEEVKRQEMRRSGVDAFISQYFVASLGFSLTGEDLPTLALRLFITGNQLNEEARRRTTDSREDFYTGVAALPGKHIRLRDFVNLMTELNRHRKRHSAVIYDITTKPPGSTENE